MDLFKPQSKKTRHVKLLTVGENKGQPRIWIEGGFPDGVEYQTPYSRIVDKANGTLTLHFHEKDAKGLKVSRKSHGGIKVPCIDINTKMLDVLFDRASKVYVEMFNDKVVISKQAVEKRRIKREHDILNDPHLHVGSSFSGGSILDIALHEGLSKSLHVKHVLYNELSEATTTVATLNSPVITSETLVVQGDIRGFDSIKDEDMPKVHYLQASTPCTSASVANRSKGYAIPEEDATTNTLFFYTLKLVERLSPAVFSVENVEKYLSSASAVIMRSAMKFMGYEEKIYFIDGKEFPQAEVRQRICMLFVSKGLASHVFDEVDAALERAKAPHTTPIGHYMEDFRPESFVKHWGLAKHDEKNKAKGNGFKQQFVKPSDTSINTLTAGLFKQRAEPRLTLGTPFTDIPPSRVPTMVEHARFKGIDPAILRGVTSQTLGHQILGNSVLHIPFAAIGEGIGKALAALRNLNLQKAG